MPKSLSIPERPAELSLAKSALEKHRETIVLHESNFLEATLPARLKMGLACLQAYQVFAQPNLALGGKAGPGRGKRVTRDTFSFEDWIAADCPWLKRPTAYKYMTALRGLALDHRATDGQVESTLAALRDRCKAQAQPAPTLASLVAAATDPVRPALPPPPNPGQQEFAFMRDTLSAFRVQAQSVLAIKDTLEANPEFMRVAMARAYQTLRDLSGQDWSPSETPDPLGSIDPDAIEV